MQTRKWTLFPVWFLGLFLRKGYIKYFLQQVPPDTSSLNSRLSCHNKCMKFTLTIPDGLPGLWQSKSCWKNNFSFHEKLALSVTKKHVSVNGLSTTGRLQSTPEICSLPDIWWRDYPQKTILFEMANCSEAAHENEPRLAVPSCHGRRI